MELERLGQIRNTSDGLTIARVKLADAEHAAVPIPSKVRAYKVHIATLESVLKQLRKAR